MFVKSRRVLKGFLILSVIGLFPACSNDLTIPSSGDTGSDGEVVDIFKPFHSDLYFGRSHLNIDEQKAYDLAVKNVLSDYSDKITDDNSGGRIKVDLAKNNILNIKNSEQLKMILDFIYQDDPRLFHISSRVPMPESTGYETVFKKDNNGNITEFYIRMHKEYFNYNDYSDDIKSMEVRIKAILDAVGDISKMSEPQIVRKVYEEYLATVSYGQKGSPSDIRGSFLKPADTNYEYYKVLCDGYARSMLYLLQRLGVKAVYIVGTTNGGTTPSLHAWNKVQVNGSWYNFDSTWDDSSEIQSPNSNKDYFLKSDLDNKFSTSHSGAQKEPDGKITGYLKYGVSMPTTPATNLDPVEYQ